MTRLRKSDLLQSMIDEAEQQGRCLIAQSGAEKARLRRAVKAGKLFMPIDDVYAPPEQWCAISKNDQLLRVVRALQILHDDWVFVGPTAAVVYGLWVSHAWLWPVHIAGDRKHSGRQVKGVVRQYIPGDDTRIVNGLRVTTLVRTVFDSLRQMPFTDGLAVADSALRTSGMTREQIAAEMNVLQRRSVGWQHAMATMRHASPLSESGGESIARARILSLGYQEPMLQVKLPNIVDNDGEFRGDFAWDVPGRGLTLGELDGVQKYVDENMTGGLSTVKVLTKERMRESRINALGVPVMRFTYKDVMDDRRFRRILDSFGIPRLDVPAYVDPGGMYVPSVSR